LLLVMRGWGEKKVSGKEKKKAAPVVMATEPDGGG